PGRHQHPHGGVDDEGGDVVEPRGREPPRRHRPGEPDPDPHQLHGGPGRGRSRVPGEAPPCLPQQVTPDPVPVRALSSPGMETIVVERDAGIVTVTLNRPEKRNAINQTMWDELLQTFEAVRRRPEDRVLVLTGAGG